MFGVTRCVQCGSILTVSDLKCVGCGRVVHSAIGAPLPCDACGQPRGSNLDCERCFPRVGPVDPADIIPERTIPPLTDDDLPFWRIRPVFVGAFCAAVALFIGYFLGRTNQSNRDEIIFGQTRQQLLLEVNQERQAIEKEHQDIAERAAAPHEFAGPAGLRWGDAPEVVRATLEKKLQFVAEGPSGRPAVFLQRFTGAFANFATDEVRSEFCQRQLSSLTVVLPNSGPSLYLRWHEVMQMMRGSFGEPSTIARPRDADAYEGALLQFLGGDLKLPPAALPPATAEVQVAEIDRTVLSGQKELRARWDFAQKASVLLATQLGAKDPEGHRRATLEWSFVKADVAAPCVLTPVVQGD
jgi:hypothetical protein